MSRHAAEQRGRGAETLAAWWLRLHGWRILARRARVPGGEVDIVARRGRTLAFVEVKARATDQAAGFSLDAYRLRRVVVAAQRLSPSSCATATKCGSTRSSSSPSACRAICPTSGKGDSDRPRL